MSTTQRIIGGLYRLTRNNPVNTDIKNMVKSFTTKYGNRPTSVWARPEVADEINGAVLCIDVVPKEKSVQPGHFILWYKPMVRNPMVYLGKRKAVK